jgi:glyoxylase-like metal-dependent hydrolase (beta-lactamase superfamily II)
VKVHRVLAPNPGLFTGAGTNTWVIQSAGRAAIVDPGPAIERHLDAIREVVDELETVAVLVSHTHPDHAPAANRLAAELGVPAYGRAPGPGFRPDVALGDGDVVAVGTVEAQVIATPGHSPDHACFRVDDALFSGDHIIGGSTVVIEDAREYIDSLERLLGTGLQIIYPGHGDPISDPDATIRDYIAHRRMRERQILDSLQRGAETVGDVVETIYEEIDRALHFAAAQSVAAHLRKLVADGVVSLPDGAAEWASRVVLHEPEEAGAP